MDIVFSMPLCLTKTLNILLLTSNVSNDWGKIYKTSCTIISPVQLLLQGQSAVHRHDITARVFRQKLKSLISYIVKLGVWVRGMLDVLSGMAKTRIATRTYTNLATL